MILMFVRILTRVKKQGCKFNFGNLIKMNKREVRKRLNRLFYLRGDEPLKRTARIDYLPGGSDREFYRITEGENTFIAMFTLVQSQVQKFRLIERYLIKRGIWVPDFIAAAESLYLLVMEDVGQGSLYKIVKSTDDNEFIEQRYRWVIESLIHMQIAASKDIEKCKPVYKRVFGYKDFRWESNYFRWSFLEVFCGYSSKETKNLDEDFHNIASCLVDEPLFFMHRDFQSTNIFFKEGYVRIVDFQDAHRGLLTYDLASLLRDAYVSLSREMRNRLFSYYYSMLREKTNLYKDIKKFRRVYVLSAIQRNMQALGAFAFLSKFMKKRWFRKAIPQGVKYLKEGLEEIQDFKVLNEIVNSKRVAKCVKSISS